MKWSNKFDVLEIENDFDKYNTPIKRGDTVIWASASSAGRPYLNEGIVIGFTKSPSFINIYCKSKLHRIVKKHSSQLVKYEREIK